MMCKPVQTCMSHLVVAFTQADLLCTHNWMMYGCDVSIASREYRGTMVNPKILFCLLQRLAQASHELMSSIIVHGGTQQLLDLVQAGVRKVRLRWRFNMSGNDSVLRFLTACKLSCARVRACA